MAASVAWPLIFAASYESRCSRRHNDTIITAPFMEYDGTTLEIQLVGEATATFEFLRKYITKIFFVK
jgi:hypothetical protein